MKEKKETKKEVYKKSAPTNESKNDVAAVPIPTISQKASNRMNFHEKVSFSSRKNDEPQGEQPVLVVESQNQQGEKRKRTAGVITANANNEKESGLNVISSSSSSSSSSGPLFGPAGAAGTRVPRTNSGSNHSDETWNAKCNALAEFCLTHGKLPPQKNTVVEVEGQGTVDLGIWCDNQKHRFKGSRGCSAFTPEQEATFRAIKEVDDWCVHYTKYAADPRFSNAAQRWESNYDALKEYCDVHKKLPSLAQNYEFQGHDLKLGRWTDNQKKRWKGVEGRVLTDDERSKLEAIVEFVNWTQKPEKKNKVPKGDSMAVDPPVMNASDFEVATKSEKGNVTSLFRGESSSSSSSSAAGGREKKKSRKQQSAASDE